MKRSFLLLISIVLLSSLRAQDSPLTAMVGEAAQSVNWENGQMDGPGGQWLLAEAGASSFLLLGESHGLAEMPQLTAALYRSLQPDYRYFATETGPETAQLLTDMLSQADPMASFRAHWAKYPWSIPFYYWREEVEMLEQMRGSADEGPVIWGLDQEFAAAYRMHFQTLSEIADTEGQRRLATEYRDRAEAEFRASFASKSPMKSFMATAKAADFERLKVAFAGHPRGRRIIEEMAESTTIYQLFFVREGFVSNEKRARLMKKHFLEYYRAAKSRGESPKVIFKFGANHMFRGANALNVLDIGNFIAEFAVLENTRSFHVLVAGKSGTQNAYTPFSRSEDDKSAPYAPNAYRSIDVSPLLAGMPDDGPSLVDLRPLRSAHFNGTFRGLAPEVIRVLHSYDVLLVIPEVHAAGGLEE